MKKLFTCLSFCAIVLALHSCTKTESDFSTVPATGGGSGGGSGPVPETITLSADVVDGIEGSSITFSVVSSINNTIVTADSKIYVNDTLITGNGYTFAKAGIFAVHASKGALNSNTISIKVTANAPTVISFVDRVLVEEYSGTWCGNCPAILYGVDLLEQQTDKAIVVSTHLFNGDPFITSQGNSLASNLGIGGVPSGRINRTNTWNGLQYQHVNDVTSQIKPKETAGLAISSTVTGGNVNATITISYGELIAGNATLTVYLVEDKLFYTQRNYSSTLYAGQPNIPNFEYTGVLRSVVSALSGDAVANSGTAVTKTYAISLPANISNMANVRLVAFVTNGAGTVVNAQEAKLGTVKNLEKL